jgi:hypothetical protein
LRVREAAPAASLWLLAAVTLAIYVVGLPSRFQIGRYLLPIVSASIPLLAIAVSWLGQRSRAAGALLLALLVAFYGAETLGVARDFAAATGRYTAGPIEKLAAHLEKAGIRFGYAPYSEAAVTTYFTEERVVLADHEERYYPLDEVELRDPALILTADDAAPTLRALDATFSEARISGYRIYWPIRYDGVPRIPLGREGWRVTASTGEADVAALLDGDPWTYWSAEQGSAPALTVDLGAERVLSGVYLALGERKNDGFQRLRIDASNDGERWSRVKDAQWGFPARFRPDGQVRVVPDDAQMVLFPPRATRWLRLALVAANPGRHWSRSPSSPSSASPRSATPCSPTRCSTIR